MLTLLTAQSNLIQVRLHKAKHFHLISVHVNINYCLHSIFQKLHFSKSNFSERPQAKCYHITILHSKSLKKCHKNFENRLTNKNFMPENSFE